MAGSHGLTALADSYDLPRLVLLDRLLAGELYGQFRDLAEVEDLLARLYSRAKETLAAIRTE